MIELTITPDIERAPWSDLREVLAPGMGKITRIGRLPRGCQSGAATVSICIRMPDGKQFVAETTMKLFLSAARAMKAVEEEMSGANEKN